MTVEETTTEETVDTTETTEETTETTETPEVEASGEEGEATETTDEGDKPKVEATAQTPAVVFNPTLKYKVRDQEHTMDDWVKGLIKDAETEKKFQDLYTKGHGLEIAKQERDQYKTKLTGIEQSLGILNNIVQQYYKSPSTNGATAAQQFIEALQLPKEMFLQYALQELKYQQMSPEQRYEVDMQRQHASRLQQLEAQNQQLESQYQQTAQLQRTQELNYALNEPSVAQVAQAYDARVGRPGAFKQLVVERGIYHGTVNKVDITPQQAIQEALQILGGSTPQGTAPSQAGQTVGTQTPVQQLQQQQQKPVIPNIQGQATVSPAKKAVKSIDDIRNRYKELTASN